MLSKVGFWDVMRQCHDVDSEDRKGFQEAVLELRVSIAVVAVVFAVIFVNTTVNMTKTTAINDNEVF